jgi:CubicO group peptidase (beta-lactamase class C family)
MTQGFSTGGLCATAGDVARFVRAVHTGALRRDLEEQMTTPRTLPDGTRLSYGFGVGVGSLGGHRLYFHGGTFFGADAQAVDFPDDDLTVVVLSNTDGAGVMEVENRISRLLLGVGPPRPRPLEDPGRYAGTYRRGDAEVVVEAGSGQLTVRGLWGDDPVPLVHLGEATFAAADQLYRVRFEAAAGERRLVLTHYGARIAVFRRSGE